jgi:hypothetical protein
MDDERWEPGMPVLDRQPAGVGAGALGGARGPATAADAALPPSLRDLPPRSVPEVAPTPLQKHYAASAPALARRHRDHGARDGRQPGSWLVKLCGSGRAAAARDDRDATLRIWRSAWAGAVDRVAGCSGCIGGRQPRVPGPIVAALVLVLGA